MKAPASRTERRTSAPLAALVQVLVPTTKSPSARGRMARGKGQSGEREVASIIRELTGHDVHRRVRQHQGDSDLEGLPGWCIEVKRYANAHPGMVAVWWSQAYWQAFNAQALPVLFYRANRADWRCVWPAALHLPDNPAASAVFNDCLVSDPLTWWRMVRDRNTVRCSPNFVSTH